MPLGILPIWKGAAGNLTLNSGQALLLASDGITEATVTQDIVNPGIVGTGHNPVMLKQEGLWQLLLQQPNSLDLTDLLARIRGQNQVQEDDQTILSLEVL